MKSAVFYFLAVASVASADQGTVAVADLPPNHAAFVDDISAICYREPFVGLLLDAQVRPVGSQEEWVSIRMFKPEGRGAVSLRAEPFGVRPDGGRRDYRDLRVAQVKQIAGNPCGDRAFVRATIGGEVALAEWFNSIRDAE